MAKPKTKEPISATIDIKLKERLNELAKQEGETLSDVVNACLLLGEAEYLLYLDMKRGYLKKIIEEKKTQLNKVPLEDLSAKTSLPKEVVTNTEVDDETE